jgi:hypothetical protein
VDNNTFNAKIAWQKACENTTKTVNAVMKTAKAANDDRTDPAYIAARIVYHKALEAEMQAKTAYMSTMAKQNFRKDKPAK